MKRPAAEGGFTLAELAVGVLVSLISTLVVMGLFTISERQRRTTPGATDAPPKGAVSRDPMDPDTRKAGRGSGHDSPIDCPGQHTDCPGRPLGNTFAAPVNADGGSARGVRPPAP